MKKLVLVLIALLECADLFSQSKEDNIWVLGYPPNDSANSYGGTILEFGGTDPTIRFFNAEAFLENSAEISSLEGDLRFYSNGCRIINSNHQQMAEGDQINPGPVHDNQCDEGDVYRTHQGLIALPWPGRDGEYAMFHLGWYRTPGWPARQYIRDIYVTHIDMNANNGLGKVLEKNTVLWQDSTLVDNMTAVRHGNGRDWWIVEPRGLTDSFYLFLLTPYGIKGPFIEKTGLRSNVSGLTAGQVVFSPDGTKYIRGNGRDGIDIFDFDRCQGKFVRGQRLPFPSVASDGVCGAAISPSSRYLYISALTKMFQYDLWAEDIERSKVLLGQYDGFVDPFPTTFYQQMLAPNGKIYMTSTNGTRYLHVIHYPDSAGLSCAFEQRGLRLATYHGFCVPNFPHFRLYDLPASPCDSLGIDAPEGYRVLWSPSDGIRLLPNPVGSGTVTVTIPPGDTGVLRVFDAAGRFLAEYKVTHERLYTLDCSDFANGVYVVTFSTAESQIPMVARLVVIQR